jgi:hypothetical protein
MPMTSSRFSPVTGKRECAVSIALAVMAVAESATGITSICARGIMMSRTCMSETASAPSMMERASASSRLRSKAECSSAISCSRSSGSRISSAERRSSSDGRLGEGSMRNQ